MKELIRTDDMILLSWLRHQLEEAGIVAAVFDGHTASLMPGVLSAIGARVMVDEGDLAAAKVILASAPGRQKGRQQDGSASADKMSAEDLGE